MTTHLKNVGFGDDVLRHGDGSINIAAYGSIARAARQTAKRDWMLRVVGTVLALPRQLFGHSGMRRQAQTRNPNFGT